MARADYTTTPKADWVKEVDRSNSIVVYMKPDVPTGKIAEALRDLAGTLDLLAPTPQTPIRELGKRAA